ncbi:uncharacterized protein LOC116304393 [Actinia tenebrosa]|uniref:Uncharacterized protein LOC116304393 n=1 Tax=Actinia tenebrosa TaxID=6105 RepID=A0A6P8IS38_ACTTE|nr:uncharacterized protein LOC116304393 [Actinia tenebrosa]XP_031569982.1 uncharacterized protein LOC116304393 [Actinia tenebrosa]
MSIEKDSKKRQKEITKEWKTISSHYSKNLKSLEDLVTKLGVYQTLQLGGEDDSMAGVQNDDIVIWKQHVTRGQQQLYNSLKKLRDLITKRKKMESASSRPIKVSIRRQSKRSLNLEDLQKHLEGYGSLTDDLSTYVAVTEQLITLGNKRVVGGELNEENATKLRDELVALNSRWNKLNGKVLRYIDRCEQFIDEIVTEHRNLSLWIVKADNMVQWLTECEKLVQREKKLGIDEETLEEQLQDVEEFLKEGSEYQPSALDVLFTGEKFVQANRLDKHDIEHVDKTVAALRKRWNAMEVHLETRQSRIVERLDVIKKGKTADKLRPWREKANSLANSFSESKEVLDSVDDKLKDGDKYEILKQCTSDIKKIEHRLLNESSEALTEVSSTGSAWMSQRQLSRDDDEEVEETVDVLHRKMSDLEETVRKNKERVCRTTANIMNQQISECEQSINDLDNASLDNFAAIGTDVKAVQKQIEDLEKFEDRIEVNEAEFNQVTQRFEDALSENMLDEPNRHKLSHRLQELEWRYKELWRENDNNKERILKALLSYSSDVMAVAHNWLSDAEERVEMIEKIDTKEKIAAEKGYNEHKRIDEELVVNEPKVRSAIALGRAIVSDKLIKEEDLKDVQKEMDEMEDRLEALKTKNKRHHIKFHSAMTENILRQEESIEISEVSEVHAELPENIDLKPTDEGFSDGESAADSQDKTKSYLDPKSVKFHAESKDMNQWIDESNRMVNEFYKEMHAKDAWKKQEKIEKLCGQKEKRQTKVNFLNKLGKEIMNESRDKEVSKEIEEELATLNNRWSDCLSMLETAKEVDVPKKKKDSACCLWVIIRRKLRTLCAYN